MYMQLKLFSTILKKYSIKCRRIMLVAIIVYFLAGVKSLTAASPAWA